ncbi:helicase HerA domain-containing protein [Stetteria hydrogenophila]
MEKSRGILDYRDPGVEVEERVRRLVERAYAEAGRYGEVVGRVSRYSEVKVEEGARVEFELDPSVYYSRSDAPFHRVGDYLAILDPKTGRLILVRVSSIIRRDELAYLGVDPPLSSYSTSPDPRGLLTRTTVLGELVVEADPGEWEVRPATTSVEPQSPVIDPKPEVLERLLDLPRSGIPLGALATPGGLVKGGGIPVRLQVRALFQHTLIIGTTGSGKTTLLKNMVSSIYSLIPRDSRPVVVVADMNQDFIQLPLPPSGAPAGSVEGVVREKVFKGVEHPKSLVAVVPFTAQDVLEAVEDGYAAPEDVAVHAALRYYRESLEPLTGVGVDAGSVRVKRGADGSLSCAITGLPFKLTIFVYTIDTPRLPSDSLLGLMPGLTPHSMDLLRRLRRSVARALGDPGPLQALYASARVYLEASKSRGFTREEGHSQAVEAIEPYIIVQGGSASDGHVYENIYHNVRIDGLSARLDEYVDAYLDALEKARPHRGTLEALYRRLSGLLDSGIVDVIVTDGGNAWILREPSWSTIVSEAHDSDAPVVLDLKWAAERSLSTIEGPRLAAYRMLASLIEWKHRAWASRGRERAPNVLIIIDEAHQFFPQEKGGAEEREASRQVASMVSKIARLGRARGVGLVFSTHSPRDLHDIVVQLANTKIILRTEKSIAEQLDVPSELKPYIPRLPDRRMVVLSHVFKEGYVLAHTSTPLTGHYDIPSTIS